MIAGEKPHSCKGCDLGWTPSFDGKFTSALGYCLPVSVRWTSLSVLAYQFKSRILLCPGVKSYEVSSFNKLVRQNVSVSVVQVGSGWLAKMEFLERVKSWQNLF